VPRQRGKSFPLSSRPWLQTFGHGRPSIAIIGHDESSASNIPAEVGDSEAGIVRMFNGRCGQVVGGLIQREIQLHGVAFFLVDGGVLPPWVD